MADKAKPTIPRAEQPLSGRKGSQPDGQRPESDLRPSGRLRRFAPYIVVIASLAAILVQVAGILLRDRLDGRSPTTRSDLVLMAVDLAAPRGVGEHSQGGRGFGVTEVNVGMAPGKDAEGTGGQDRSPVHGKEPAGSPDAADKSREPEKAEPRKGRIEAEAKQPSQAKPAAPAPENLKAQAKPKAEKPTGQNKVQQTAKSSGKATETQSPKAPARVPVPPKASLASPDAKIIEVKEKPAQAASQPVQAPPSKPGVQQPPPKAVVQPRAGQKEAFKADPSGGYAVAAGAFSTMRLASVMEQRLEDLGFPHFRTVVMKEANGYQLVATAASEAVVQNALKALSEAGYRTEKTGSEITCRFFTEEEAGRAKAVAEKAGAAATVKKASGEIPLWRIMVGPTTSENAKKALEVLKAEGMDCVIVRYKP